MKLSICIPSYNQVQYLPDAIDSCLRQTVKPFEIIVVDDGSTDGSLDVAKKYPIKVISQVNKGLSSARNTGIMNAKGTYILFLDSDDILKDNCVERILEEIQKTKADVVSPSFRSFGVSAQDFRLMPNPTFEDFKVGNRVGYCSAIKRSALLEIGGYSPRMTFGYEDYHLWFDLTSRGKKIVTVPEVLWLYRTKENSMITTAMQHHEELMNQIKKDFNV